MLKMPDDPVSQFQAMLGEQRVQNNIKRNHFAVEHEIADLPADASRTGPAHGHIRR